MKTVSIYDCKNKDIIGTGFYIGPNLILTCYHVVVHKRKLRAIIYNTDRDVYADIYPLFKCKRFDFAIYECVQTSDEYWDLGDSDAIEIGDELYYFCPHEKQRWFSSKVIHNSGMYDDDDKCTSDLLNNSIILHGDKLVSGTSGSPLYNESGEIIGLHWLVGLRNFKHRQASVPINIIKKYLLKNRDKWEKDK